MKLWKRSFILLAAPLLLASAVLLPIGAPPAGASTLGAGVATAELGLPNAATFGSMVVSLTGVIESGKGATFIGTAALSVLQYSLAGACVPGFIGLPSIGCAMGLVGPVTISGRGEIGSISGDCAEPGTSADPVVWGEPFIFTMSLVCSVSISGTPVHPITIDVALASVAVPGVETTGPPLLTAGAYAVIT